MDETASNTIMITLFLASYLLIKITRKRPKNLPPTPLSLPIIGHLHLLKKPLHQALNNLSQKYGPIISLRLGSHRAISISSASAAEECFTKNGAVFANRPHSLFGKYVSYNNTGLVLEDYNDHYRNLRRIVTVEVLSSNRLNKFLSIRADEVKFLLGRLYRVSCEGFARVELRPLLMDLASNIIMRMVVGKRYYGDETNAEEGRRFRKIVTDFEECFEMIYIGDVIPSLKWTDFGRSAKKYMNLGQRFDSFLQGLVDEHHMDKNRDTMINHLLAMQESDPHSYSDEIIKGLIQVLFLGGAETSGVTIEWAFINLLNNPRVLKKLKEEIDTKIGEDRLIEESDLPNLSYLQNVISENFRLCPVSPVLAHKSSEDCTIGGFDVPANTMLFANAWAMHRDPTVWDDPTSFKPERFENNGDQRFKLLAFGQGRRSCPGEGLAIRTINLTLGSLIQCFEWERVDGQEIDTRVKVTSVMIKAEPLQVICKPRPILHKLF
ncbi:cytochrome P450 81Q32-like [Mercurialis annua]|uniref:cytochrome P450 81Q32-like n=1 Tax=Mercurialis annua TaxID=3986 RepID=UPI00215E7018|nr:cytochrome P450 81Q32-like [Mercurialis annua]